MIIDTNIDKYDEGSSSRSPLLIIFKKRTKEMKRIIIALCIILMLCTTACTQIDDVQATPSAVTITIAEDGSTAHIEGYTGEKCARVAMIMDFNGETGLYLTTCRIDDNDTVTIPRFDVDGIDVVSISVAVAENTETLMMPNPDVIAAAHIDVE